MTDKRQGFVDYITRILPEDEKAKAPEYVVVMEEYFQKLQDLIGKAYDEPRVPAVLRANIVHRIIITASTICYLTEGPHAMIETAKNAVQNMIAAKAALAAQQVKEGKIEVVKDLKGVKK